MMRCSGPAVLPGLVLGPSRKSWLPRWLAGSPTAALREASWWAGWGKGGALLLACKQRPRVQAVWALHDAPVRLS